MSKTLIRRPWRTFCVGDLRDQILLQDRSIQAPDFDLVDFTEKFDDLGGVWASIKTSGGKTIFDDHQQRDHLVTHEVVMRFDSRVTSETWLLLADGRRLDIINTENLEERDSWLILQCSDRGPKADLSSSI